MVDTKELIKKINEGSLSHEEQLNLLAQVEQTIKEQKQKKEETLQLKTDYIIQAFNKIKTDLETRIAEIEGKEPIKGDKGEKGDKGDRGLDGYQGRDGKDGKDGKDGLDGQDGVGVADARIDFDGTLVITLTNGKEITAGDVMPLDVADKLQVFYNNNAGGGGGGGAVDSVNGQTGVVVLTASDVGAATSAQGALADSSVQPGDLATVATTGSYNDLSDKPTIPLALTVKDEGATLSSAVTSIDFTGAGVTATNTGGAISVAISGGGSGISSADIQEFTTAGTSTWTKPAGAKLVYILAYGGGGGGGSGRRRASGSSAAAAYGGGGGAAGGRVELWIPATELGATETVTVGAGGTGGAAKTVDDSNGASGVEGGSSSVGSWILSRGGGAAFGGTTASGVQGTLTMSHAIAYSTTSFFSSSGSAGQTNAISNANRGGYNGGGGSGAGGFAAASTTEAPGGAGGKGGSAFTTTISGSSGGGTAGAVHGNGGNGSNATTYFVGGDGGGGGGSGSSVAAGAGGNGGYPGGGGGGGGAGHAANSGAGGNGGDGYVRIVTFF